MEIPTGVSIVLEFVRILFIFLIGVILLLVLETWLYNIAGVDISEYALMPATANIIIVLVFYRNVLQFTSWFKSHKNSKISNRNTKILLSISIILIILPLLFNYRSFH